MLTNLLVQAGMTLCLSRQTLLLSLVILVTSGYSTEIYCQSSSITGVVNWYRSAYTYDDCSGWVEGTDMEDLVPGDRVLVIQMTGARINQSNSSSYGSITGIDVAGNFEFATVQSVASNRVTFTAPLARYYRAEGLQIVRVPQYNDVTVTGTLTAPAWNGDVGGVVVIEASGSVTLDADIEVSGLGFAGGSVSGNSNLTGRTDYYYDPSSNEGGEKGKGVAELAFDKSSGRGAPANGGGGGNGLNSGGGGGANYGSGGGGGYQTNQYSGQPLPSLDIGGLGGRALSYSGADTRVYMGGGGGGGHQNSSAASPGGRGGGIVIIRAGSIVGSGGHIRANGVAASASGNDGAGGGGGGGGVYLMAGSYPNAVTVEAKGGDGGLSLSELGTGICNGPGGGGGGGLVWFSQSSAPVMVTTVVMQGQTSQAACWPPSTVPYGGGPAGVGGLLFSLQLPGDPP